MFIIDIKECPSESDREKINIAMNIVCSEMPYLSGLATSVRIYVHPRIQTAGVSENGRLLIGETFLHENNTRQMAFALAHELFHLLYMTHEREKGFTDGDLVNIAHDFIINEELFQVFPPQYYPKDILDWSKVKPSFKECFPKKQWKPASMFSLEELVSLLKPMRDNITFLAYCKKLHSAKSAPPKKETPQKTSPKKEFKPPVKTPSKGGLSSSSLGSALSDLFPPAEEPPQPKETSEETSAKAPVEAPSEAPVEAQAEAPTDAPAKVPEETPSNSVANGDKQDLWDILFPKLNDVLSAEQMRELFPDEVPEESEKQERQFKKKIQEAAANSSADRAVQEEYFKTEGDFLDRVKKIKTGQGSSASNCRNAYTLLRGVYQTPWEAALQRWFDSVAPGDRTFAKASRRGAWRTDVILPGRKREGWTLHIVLDTSGSMTSSLKKALGAIDFFCQNNGVEQIHILQCDTTITADEWIEVGELEHFQATGFGGSDMSPAMNYLAQDPEVEAIVVITDGYISYPPQEPPYETLWCIVDGRNPQFNYGTVIEIENE